MRGGGNTRNLIAFIDSDDVISKNYFQNLIFALESHKGAKIAKSIDVCMFKNRARFDICQRKSRGFLKKITPKNISERCEVWRAVFDYETIKNLRFGNMQVIEDIAFSVCAHALAQNVVFTRKARYFYRKYPHSITKTCTHYPIFEAFLFVYEFLKQNDLLKIYGLPSYFLYHSKEHFGDFETKKAFIESLNLSDELINQNRTIKNFLDSENEANFLRKNMSFGERVRQYFRIKISHHRSEIRLFGITIYKN